MEIYFLRHGDAEIPLFKTPRADYERNLTEHGIKTTLEEAFGLKEFVPGFDVVFTSPIVRAVQTASIFGEVFNCIDEVRKLDALLPPGDIEALMEAIALMGDVERVLCVGHSPSLEMMATEIITGLEEERLFPLKTGGILCFRIEKPQLHAEAEIDFLMDPVYLVRIGQTSGFKSHDEPDFDEEDEEDEEFFDEKTSPQQRRKEIEKSLDFSNSVEEESDFLA